MQMASVMEIKSEAFGRCVEGIDVLVEVEADGFVVGGYKSISDVIQGSLFTLLVAANCARYWICFQVLLGMFR